MNWWCTASKETWEWVPRAYPGIWVMMAVILGWYLLARRHAPEAAATSAIDSGQDVKADSAASSHRAAPQRTDRWRLMMFLGGWVVLWIATDWPLGTLGAGYLASVHMFQFVLFTSVAAPLLVAGVPEWMMRRTLARTRSYRLVKAISRPVVAGVIFNVIVISTHAPITVDAFRSSELGSFVLDAAWLVGGVILWMPIVSALDELRPGYAARAVYLFLAAGVVPMIPGGFLTFSETPLYATYELAPRIHENLGATDDQQIAGALMKVGNIPLIWPVIGTLFFRWARESGSLSSGPTKPTTSPTDRVNT